MSEFYAIEAIGVAFNRTKNFFKQPNLMKKWIKFGFILFIFAMFGGGGGGGGGSSYSDGAGSGGFPTFTPEEMTFIIAAVLVLVVIVLVLGFIFSIIKNTFFFSMLDSLKAGDVRIREFVSKNFSKGLNLTILEMVFLIIFVILTALFLLPGILLGNFLLLMILILPLLLIGFVLFLIAYVISQFTRYLMFVEGLNAFPAFKKSLTLVRNNLTQVVVLILMQIILGLGLGLFQLALWLLLFIILGLIALVVVGIPAAIIFAIIWTVTAGALSVPIIILLIIIGVILLILTIIVIVYIITTILAPIDAFFLNYDLAFIELILGKGKAIKEVKPTKSVNVKKRISSETA